MNTAPATTALDLRWDDSRDDYGRKTWTLIDWTGGTYTVIGRVYRVPARTRQMLGYSHGSNDWTRPDRARAHAEHQTLREAKARLEDVARRLNA